MTQPTPEALEQASMVETSYGSTDGLTANNDRHQPPDPDVDGNHSGDNHQQRNTMLNNHENASDDHSESILATWMMSPFAVGMTKSTWKDENIGCSELCTSCCSGSRYAYVHLSAFVCAKFPCVGRVGNMPVLKQDMQEVIDPSTGQRIGERPRLRYMVGPYWPVPFCFLVPGFGGFSVFTFLSRDLEEEALYLVIIWAFLNSLVLLSLFQVACSDPGILYRHSEPPPGQDDWRWNDQAQTYRPAHAKFDPECGVVIQHFDHTCPWTGTAIGKNNMNWFRVFVFSILVTTMLNAFFLVYRK